MRSTALIFILVLFTSSLIAQDKTVFSSVSLGTDTSLEWKVQHNKLGVYFIVQQNRWNSWKDLDTIRSGPDSDSAAYSQDVSKYLFNGENKFRVRATAEKMLVYSKIVKITSNRSVSKEIKHKYNKRKDTIDLGREEYFELYDFDGKVIRRGFARTLSLSDLAPGHYFLNYGERSSEFTLSD
jgi:hypothetical protein